MPQTVFVTGASGFIAKHILLQLLDAGHSVRGSLRSLSRADEVRDALRPHLADPAALDRLGFVALDLTRDDGWDQAMAGCDVLMHTASPFRLEVPKNPDDLIRPAVDGTLRALRAATRAGIDRVILTSSLVAVYCRDVPARGMFTEDDWSEIEHPRCQPYMQSKTLAERAAWDYVAGDGADMRLTVINPGFVYGPPLDRHYGASLSLIERVLGGKDPMLPGMYMSAVDVRDVAQAHVRAMHRPDSAGLRILAVAGPVWLDEIGRILKAEFPERRITTRRAPIWLLRILATFDGAIRAGLPFYGEEMPVSNQRAREVLGMQFRDPKTAVTEAAAEILRLGAV